MLTTARPMFDAGRKFIGYIGTSIDISNSKNDQMEIYKSHMELAHARRVSSIGELASSLAHELNQPLSAILSNAQAAIRYLRAKPQDIEEVAAILGDIVADDKRAGMIIRRLRSFVKKKELEMEILDINNVVREVVALLHGKAMEREVRVVMDLGLNLPVISCDVIQLQQVLLNLMINGFDAMDKTPVDARLLVIQTRLTYSHEVELIVMDAGRSDSPEGRIEHIFQPFFTTKKEGLGMGLSIARTIVEAHRGRLWAENNPQGGGVFHMTLSVKHE